jgi:hypothetical protein
MATATGCGHDVARSWLPLDGAGLRLEPTWATASANDNDLEGLPTGPTTDVNSGWDRKKKQGPTDRLHHWGSWKGNDLPDLLAGARSSGEPALAGRLRILLAASPLCGEAVYE